MKNRNTVWGIDQGLSENDMPLIYYRTSLKIIDHCLLQNAANNSHLPPPPESAHRPEYSAH